jgi:hypothetical protein
MYIDSLTITAIIVFIVYLAAFIGGCLMHNCSAPCTDKMLCGDDIHEGERSWSV